MRWAIVRVWDDGGLQAVKRHDILKARYYTPFEAMNDMYALQHNSNDIYYVRCIGEDE